MGAGDGSAGNVPITSDKVATLGPTWRRFGGLTVLLEGAPGRFDGPGDRLYEQLSAVVGGLGAGTTAERYGLCLLPPRTYHVTLCDGPNARWLDVLPASVLPAYRWLVEGGDAAGPGDGVALALPPELDLLDPARLHARVSRAPVTMQVAEIQLTRHAVMAALVPADEESTRHMPPLRRARRAYAATLDTELGLATSRWRPHVSVGYLASPALLAGAEPLVDGWNARLAETPAATVRFTGAALYRFTDMASYARIRGA